MKLLIAYGTTDGQTARIAEAIAARLHARGAEVRVVDAARLPRGLRPSAFDGIMVGASVHVMRFQLSVRKFVRRNLDALRARPSAFFSVCLGIASKDSASRDHALRIAREFPVSFGWRPWRVEVFAGAMPFSRYGLIRRPMMRRIARKEMGEVDVQRDYDLTDWDRVNAFSDEFIASLGPPAAPEPTAHPT